MLAAQAARELDTVRALYTGWVVAGTEGQPGGARPSAAMLHLVHECTGTVQDGKPTLARPRQRRVLRYPGIWEVKVRTVGHPEPITLPRTFPDVETRENVLVGRSC